MSSEAVALACAVCSCSVSAEGGGLQCSQCLARHPDEPCALCSTACFKLHFTATHRRGAHSAPASVVHSRPSSPAPSLALSCDHPTTTNTTNSDKPNIPANPPRAPKFLRAPMRPSAAQSSHAATSPAPKAPGTPRHGNAVHHHALTTHQNAASVQQGRQVAPQGQHVLRGATASPTMVAVPPHPNAMAAATFTGSAATQQLLSAVQVTPGGMGGQLTYTHHTPLSGGPLGTLTRPIHHLPLQLHTGAVLPASQMLQVPVVVRYGGY